MRTSRWNLLIIGLSCSVIFGGCEGRTDEALRVIYTGRLAGYLEPCPCPEGRVGGLSRFGYAVQDSLQRWNRKALLLDAGEWADPYVLPGDLKNQAILKAFSVLSYDAVNVCGRDLITGIDILMQAKNTLHIPLISANLVDAETGKRLFAPSVLRDIGETRVAIIGLGDHRSEDLLRAGLGHLTYMDHEEALNQALKEIGPGCDVVILLCDFSARIARGLSVKFPDISVIISSRDLLPSQDVNRYGSTYVLGSSRRGVRLTSFSLTRPETDSLNCRYSAVLLRDDVRTHPQIERIIKDYRTATASGKPEDTSSR